MITRKPQNEIYTGARQRSGHFARLMLVSLIMGLFGIVYGEGTKQLEPKSAPVNSVCKIVFSKNQAEYRIPFALVGCKEDYRLNITISDYTTEKIYLGFGDVINYLWTSVLYHDVKFQIKGPDNKPVTGYGLQALPQSGKAGFIDSRAEADAGPEIQSSNPAGYAPLVISPAMNGNYVIEFQIPDAAPDDSAHNEMRLLKYFDASVAKGHTIIPGRLWSKAWQLATRSVQATASASYALFYIYTGDSIVTRFDCNGLAGGAWAIYSNQWGSSASGEWSDRRQSQHGNAAMKPEYKIFLNDPDSMVFPTGYIGEMIDFNVVPNVCDTVITFETFVSKGGNIDIHLDIDPPNPGSFGSEDVQLGYNVVPGHNILLPAWDGRDGNGIPLANKSEVNAKIRFLNGLSNVPLYDVEDNPKGFKVDIQRPKPASGTTKLKLFWDDTKLPSQYSPTSNVINGCLYNTTDPVSGCHRWTRAQNLGDTNTINSWWYLSTDQILEKTVTLIIRPSSGHITGPADVCKSQDIRFKTTSMLFAQQCVWQISGSGFSADYTSNSPDTTLVYKLNDDMPAGNYLVSVFGRNSVCGDGVSVKIPLRIHERPVADFKYNFPCQGVGVTFMDKSIAADALLNEFTWSVNSEQGENRIFRGNPVVIVFDSMTTYTVTASVTDLLGCNDTSTRKITIIPKPVSSFKIIESEDNTGELHFDNQTTGASEYSWNFGNTISSALFEPYVKYNLEGDYTITLVAANPHGCKDTTLRQYYFMPGLWLPDAFSPNDDKQNDIFGPVTQRTTLAPYQLLVFDRWGQMIFKSTDPALGWDGKYKENFCPTGSYNFLIQYREATINGSEIVSRRGMVSLIR